MEIHSAMYFGDYALLPSENRKFLHAGICLLTTPPCHLGPVSPLLQSGPLLTPITWFFRVYHHLLWARVQVMVDWPRCSTCSKWGQLESFLGIFIFKLELGGGGELGSFWWQVLWYVTLGNSRVHVFHRGKGSRPLTVRESARTV